MIEPRYTFTKTYDHTLRHKQETNFQHVDFGDASENDVIGTTNKLSGQNGMVVTSFRFCWQITNCDKILLGHVVNELILNTTY